jgi:hypothetical protein
MNDLERGRRQPTGDEQAYLNELLGALRMRGVPGPRIAEFLAEVSSHLSETGEDPREAFGPAKAYADELTAALGARNAPTSLWRSFLTWSAAGYGVGGGLGGWLVIDGGVALAVGERGVGGLPAIVPFAVGSAILLTLAFGMIWLARRDNDRVLDPRSGADMAGPLPRWALPLMIAVPVIPLVVAVVFGVISR